MQAEAELSLVLAGRLNVSSNHFARSSRSSWRPVQRGTTWKFSTVGAGSKLGKNKRIIVIMVSEE